MNELISHSAYSPDLSPSENLLFPNMMMTLEHRLAKCIMLEGYYIKKRSNGSKVGWLLIYSPYHIIIDTYSHAHVVFKARTMLFSLKKIG